MAVNTEHILVVEDTNLIRTLVHSRLEAGGYQVTGVSTVSEALRAIKTRMPDLLILDLGLATEDLAELGDGFAFLGLLRRTYPKADPAVIIYSVNHSPEVEARAKSMGAVAVMDKKAGVPALLNVVRAALEERKSKQSAQTEVNCA
jgi:DNA-binding response OmpR family regulator